MAIRVDDLFVTWICPLCGGTRLFWSELTQPVTYDLPGGGFSHTGQRYVNGGDAGQAQWEGGDICTPCHERKCVATKAHREATDAPSAQSREEREE